MTVPPCNGVPGSQTGGANDAADNKTSAEAQAARLARMANEVLPVAGETGAERRDEAVQAASGNASSAALADAPSQEAGEHDRASSQDQNQGQSQDRDRDRPRGPRGSRQQNGKPKRDKRDVHGWVLLDKPVGMTSTHAVAVIKRLFSAKRAGHAGTLDPLASGALPIAMGEATKTVPFVMDGRKVYRFTVCWGEERDTDDTEGRVVQSGSARPSESDILALIPRFLGTIDQVPPQFSAIKIAGERAYDLARDGETVELQSRQVEIHRLELVERPDDSHAVFEAECGKGTYVRAIARDMGRILGVFGHVCALRRTTVGPFAEKDMILLEQLEALCHRAASGEGNLAAALLPVETALDDIPALAVSRADAARLQRGQAVIMRGRDAPIFRGTVYVTVSGDLLALAEIDRGEIVPKRVFNLAGLRSSAAPREGH